MRYSTQVKPISYVKANAAEVLDSLAENRQPLIITQNGEARAVLQDLATYENTRETMMLLKVLALGMRQVEAGETVPVAAAFARARGRLEASGRIERTKTAARNAKKKSGR